MTSLQTMNRGITFFYSPSKIIFLRRIMFVGLVALHEASQREPSTFRVMNISKRPQADMQSSAQMEAKQINPFRLPCLRHCLIRPFKYQL